MARKLPISGRWLVAFAVGGSPAANVLRAESPPAVDPDPDGRPTVERLVQTLGSGSLESRDAAERMILELGPVVLPALLEAGVGATGESGFRLRGIRSALEQRAAVTAIDGSNVSVSVAGNEPIGSKGVRIRLRIAWERGTTPIVMKLPLRSIVAEGPGGEAMPPHQRSAVLEAAVPSDRRWLDLPVSLGQPEPPLQKIDTLRGTLSVWITGLEHEFTFPQIGRGTAAQRSIRLGKARVTLEEVAVRRDRLLAMASVAYDEPSEALASHHPWLSERPLELVAADGTVIEPVSARVRSRSDRGLTAAAEFAWPPAANPSLRNIGLRWKIPIAIHEIPIDFSIRNIPLAAEAQ